VGSECLISLIRVISVLMFVSQSGFGGVTLPVCRLSLAPCHGRPNQTFENLEPPPPPRIKYADYRPSTEDFGFFFDPLMLRQRGLCFLSKGLLNLVPRQSKNAVPSGGATSGVFFFPTNQASAIKLKNGASSHLHKGWSNHLTFV